jgi:hypothetical protein
MAVPSISSLSRPPRNDLKKAGFFMAERRQASPKLQSGTFDRLPAQMAGRSTGSARSSSSHRATVCSAREAASYAVDGSR